MAGGLVKFGIAGRSERGPPRRGAAQAEVPAFEVESSVRFFGRHLRRGGG